MRGLQLLAHAIDDRFRQQDLAAVRRGHDARRAIDGAAEVIVVAPLDVTDVKSAADSQLKHVRFPGRSDSALDRHGSAECGDGSSNAA